MVRKKALTENAHHDDERDPCGVLLHVLGDEGNCDGAPCHAEEADDEAHDDREPVSPLEHDHLDGEDRPVYDQSEHEVGAVAGKLRRSGRGGVLCCTGSRRL